ncbi:hypothetical protein B0T10DRAFT_463639 [Thelonectria olida]|uniref:C2H2-domain containing protein second zinc finger domain-containing protein n=1 Tax=Thelonectria olida TaxID=1576542 RepID=A0A9P8VXR1_9HYPO|nr:hypothetical protein B0T10DRAFT_463639 [Thelonectria olida]
MDIRFGSAIAVTRHEREAHSDISIFCTYAGCNRAVPGRGFKRQRNFDSHLRKRHAPDTSNTSNDRKRKTEVPDDQASSRKAIVKSMPAPDTDENLTRPLLDQWIDLYPDTLQKTHPDSREVVYRPAREFQDGYEGGIAATPAHSHLPSPHPLQLRLLLPHSPSPRRQTNQFKPPFRPLLPQSRAIRPPMPLSGGGRKDSASQSDEITATPRVSLDGSKDSGSDGHEAVYYESDLR